MKLLFVVHDYLPSHPGGTEIHAHQVARALVGRGHQVCVLHTERDLSAPEGDLREGELDGVTTLEMVHQREYADVRESWLQPLARETLRAILAHRRPDAVHFHHLARWGSGSLASAREAGLRPVVTLNDFHLFCDRAVLLTGGQELCGAGPRGECSDCLRSEHPLRTERWEDADGASEDDLWRRAARERFEQHREHLLLAERVMCPSRFLADLFIGAGMLREDQVFVSKYGYPGERRDPRPSDPAEPLRVGYVGGLYPSKGVHVLAEAFARLPRGAARLDVWGALDWFPTYVDDLRARLGGADATFHGPFEPGRVDDVMGGFDVLAVPSIWYENMPLTIQEAFRNGLPVVTTDLGGMAESVQDGVSGLLFPRGDAAGLQACLERLAGDRELLFRLAQGRPHVPTLEEVVDRLEGVYREVGG